MENDLQHTENTIVPPKRPQLLTVLCILSFIMCGFGLLGGIYQLIQNQPEAMQERLEKIRSFNPQMADQMENDMAAMQDSTFTKISPYINFMFLLLSFLGVMMMWNLNKNGFFLYSIAEILPYMSFLFVKTPTVQIPGMSSDMVAKIMISFMVIMILTDVLFVWLYSKNMKYFR